MTDTPETDAAWSCFKGCIEPLQDVKELSRKLERERDDWKHRAESYETSYNELKERINLLKRMGILSNGLN